MALSDAQKESQLRAVGWSPSAGDSVAAAWSRTATPSDQAAANAPSAPSGPAPAPGGPPPAAGSPDLSGYVAAMQASSGLSIKDLNEKIREFDATIAQQQKMWEQQGLPQLAIAQRTADLEDKKFAELQSQATFTQNLQTRQQDLATQVAQGQLTNAQAQQQLAREIQTGQLALAQKTQGDSNAIAQGQLGVSQGQLGLDTMKVAAGLSGPADWLRSLNFSRGVAGNPTLPGFVNRLLTGQNTAAIGGPAQEPMPAAASMQTIGGNLGAVPATPQWATPAAQPATPAAQPATPAPTPDVATPTAQQAGYWSVGTDGTRTFTPTAPTAQAADTGAGTGAALDPQHLAQFYVHAVNAANTGGSASATTPAWATPSDVSTAMGRPSQQTQADATSAGLQKLYTQGGQALGPQQWEGLLKSEKDAATGGMATLGGDVPSWLEQQARSRIGQTAATPTMVGAGT